MFAEIPPIFQFVSIASGLVTGHHWKEPGSGFFAPSLQLFMDIYKILPEPSLLQAEQPQFPQPFLIGRGVPVPSPSLWPFAGLSPVCPCLSRTGEPRTGHSTPGEASPVLSRGEGSHLSTC